MPAAFRYLLVRRTKSVSPIRSGTGNCSEILCENRQSDKESEVSLKDQYRNMNIKGQSTINRQCIRKTGGAFTDVSCFDLAGKLSQYPVLIWQGSCLNALNIAKTFVLPRSIKWWKRDTARAMGSSIRKLCFKIWSRQNFGVLHFTFEFEMSYWFQNRKVWRPVLNQIRVPFYACR